MYAFFLLSAIISLCRCDPRTPRIYNVLISTKKNLAPSQALPVYEPVLRTTSVGLAFPPLLYTPITTISAVPNPYINAAPSVRHVAKDQSAPQPEAQESAVPNDYVQADTDKLKADGANLPKNVLPLEQYVPYYTPLTYEPYYPKEKQAAPAMNLEKYLENSSNDPKQIVANLKKNSDIPDVPPPPLPVTTKA